MWRSLHAGSIFIAGLCTLELNLQIYAGTSAFYAEMRTRFEQNWSLAERTRMYLQAAGRPAPRFALHR